MATRLNFRTTKSPARRRPRTLKKTAIHTARLQPEVVGLELLAAPRVVSLALAVTCVALLLYFSFDSRFYIFDLQVSGNQRLDAREVIEASGLEGLHIAWAHTEQAAHLIASRLPNVRAATIRCALPARCTIAVEERQPVFFLQQGNVWLGVDAEGIVFTAQQAEGMAVIQIQSGKMPLPGAPADRHLLEAVEALRPALGEGQVLRLTDGRGLEFSDPHGGWPVYLGTGPGIEARVNTWQALSAELARRGVQPAFIDVRYAQAPYYSIH